VKNQRISLFGYGITTRAIAEKFGPSTFYDDNVNKPFTDKFGNRLRPSDEFDPRYSDLEIPSPGIAPNNPLIKKAKHLTSEYDLFLADNSAYRSPISTKPFTVWITGTNGKTTTTQMTEHLLRDKGALAGGNIGTPLAKLDENAPLWILETSSFTMHYTEKAKPDIFIVLPITPDHLSWHGSYEAYIEDKLKPLQLMREGEAIILPREFAKRETAGFVIPYDSAEDLAEYFGFDLSKIRFKGAFLLDAVLAMAVGKILYDRSDYDGINSFKMDPHRQEELSDIHGRLWVNDTKATNPDATLSALQNYKDKQIHLILGGDDKGVDLQPLFEELRHLDVVLYTIGSNQPRLDEFAKRYNIPCVTSKTLVRAIDHIDKAHTLQSVALLSPAAASLDQFPSYAVRGNEFKETVKKLS
jgi:UDP-N-acetylmuramoylalanine--D-glutamate ligase